MLVKEISEKSHKTHSVNFGRVDLSSRYLCRLVPLFFNDRSVCLRSFEVRLIGHDLDYCAKVFTLGGLYWLCLMSHGGSCAINFVGHSDVSSCVDDLRSYVKCGYYWEV